MDNRFEDWMGVLACPLDGTPLPPASDAGATRCPRCGFEPGLTEIDSGRAVPDFRAVDVSQTVSMQFQLPTIPLKREDLIETGFQVNQARFQAASRLEVNRRYGTKLDRGLQYYARQWLEAEGPDMPILDLGCGSGGNRRFLEELGFRRVLSVDWSASGAAFLVDAHRLPFQDGVFGAVIATAVWEHLYNPFLAMAEVSRVLRPGGRFLGSASFWEAWHASSYFHLTPDGWHAILTQAGLDMVDFWVGWGVIPAALSHVLTPGHLRGVGYWLQSAVEAVYRLTLGETGVRKLQLRASGSYLALAEKRVEGVPRVEKMGSARDLMA